jgi:hypothetical protein
MEDGPSLRYSRAGPPQHRPTPVPWDVAVPDSDLDIDLPMLPGPLQKVFKIRTKYIAQSTAARSSQNPTALFGALEGTEEDSRHASNLTGLP